MPAIVEITNEEKSALRQFKERLSNVKIKNKDLLEERRLINWLRARNLKVDDAERMFRRHLEWREAHKIDTILTVNCLPPNEDVRSQVPADIVGVDKQGNILLVVVAEDFEIRKMVQKYGKEVALDLLFILLETAYKEVVEKSTDPNVLKKANYIVDMEGFKFHDVMSTDVLDLIITSLKTVEANYPELLHKAFVLNAPFIFSVLWNTVKPFLSPKTLEKVTILGQNPEKIKSTLLELIAMDQLPRRWGGMGVSERVPALNMSRSLSNPKLNLAKEDELQETVIQPGDIFQLSFEVERPKALLSWIFKTKNYDIGFSVRFKPFDDEKACKKIDATRDKIEYKRINAHKGIHSGSIVCDTPGLYVLRFDNSYSRFREKTLRYHAQLHQLTMNGNNDDEHQG